MTKINYVQVTYNQSSQKSALNMAMILILPYVCHKRTLFRKGTYGRTLVPVPPQTLFQVCAKRRPTQRQSRRRRVLSDGAKVCIHVWLVMHWSYPSTDVKHSAPPDDCHWLESAQMTTIVTTQAAGEVVSQCRHDARFTARSADREVNTRR